MLLEWNIYYLNALCHAKLVLSSPLARENIVLSGLHFVCAIDISGSLVFHSKFEIYKAKGKSREHTIVSFLRV